MWKNKKGLNVSSWAQHCTEAQRATIHRIRAEHGEGTDSHRLHSEGWTIYMMPTTGQATYVELRHYLMSGRMARWVVEKDGTVSAHNHHGQENQLTQILSRVE